MVKWLPSESVNGYFKFFLWIKPCTFWCTNAFANQYTTHKYIKYPKHSPMKLFGSLLIITYRRLPNCQDGKAFRKNSIDSQNVKRLIVIRETSKKHPSQIYKQWKSNWYTSSECFEYDNPELSCWNCLQWWSMGIPFCLDNFSPIFPPFPPTKVHITKCRTNKLIGG